MNKNNQSVKHQDAAKTYNKIWMVLILGALTAFGPLSMDMYLPGLPGVADDFHTSASIAQLTVTATLVGLGLGQLIFGPLSDIVGRKRPLQVMLTIYALVSISAVFTPNIWLFVFLRFIQGISGAAGMVIARAASRDMYTGKDLTKFISMLATVNGAAPILAPLAGGFILNFAMWRFVFVVLFVIGVLMMLAVTFTLPETLPEKDRQEGNVLETTKSFNLLLKDRTFIGISLAQAFTRTSMYAYIAGSPFVLQNIYDVTPFQFSMIFATNGIGLILAAQFTGKLSANISETRLLKWGVAITFVGGLLLLATVLFSWPIWALLPAFFMVVFSVGNVNTTSFSLGLQRQEKMTGSASAFLGIMPFVGGGIASPLVGVAGDFSAVPLAIVIFISSTMAFIIYHALVKPKHTTVKPGSSPSETVQ